MKSLLATVLFGISFQASAYMLDVRDFASCASLQQSVRTMVNNYGEVTLRSLGSQRIVKDESYCGRDQYVQGSYISHHGRLCFVGKVCKTDFGSRH